MLSAHMTPLPNRLFYGDNLDVLTQHIADADVDLVYIDPPFNSSAKSNFCSPSEAARKPRSSTMTLQKRRSKTSPSSREG
jgi:16S rRNA G966 N2-methylase RsmD